MGKGKLILAAIVAAVGITSYLNRDNISSYLEQRAEYSKKQQERVIPYSDSLKSLGSDGINAFYKFNLNGKDIALEVTNKDSLTTKVDSLVIGPEGSEFLSSNKKYSIYSIKRKISR